MYCILVYKSRKGRKSKATGIKILIIITFLLFFVQHISEFETEKDKVKSTAKVITCSYNYILCIVF